MKLIENWTKSYKMLSVQAMALATAIQGVWVTLPPELLVSIPPNVVHYVTIGLMIAGVLGRLVPQDSVK